MTRDSSYSFWLSAAMTTRNRDNHGRSDGPNDGLLTAKNDAGKKKEQKATFGHDLSKTSWRDKDGKKNPTRGPSQVKSSQVKSSQQKIKFLLCHCHLVPIDSKMTKRVGNRNPSFFLLSHGLWPIWSKCECHPLTNTHAHTEWLFCRQRAWTWLDISECDLPRRRVVVVVGRFLLSNDFILLQDFNLKTLCGKLTTGTKHSIPTSTSCLNSSKMVGR